MQDHHWCLSENEGRREGQRNKTLIRTFAYLQKGTMSLGANNQQEQLFLHRTYTKSSHLKSWRAKES